MKSPPHFYKDGDSDPHPVHWFLSPTPYPLSHPGTLVCYHNGYQIIYRCRSIHTHLTPPHTHANTYSCKQTHTHTSISHTPLYHTHTKARFLTVFKYNFTTRFVDSEFNPPCGPLLMVNRTCICMQLLVYILSLKLISRKELICTYWIVPLYSTVTGMPNWA